MNKLILIKWILVILILAKLTMAKIIRKLKLLVDLLMLI